MTPDEYCQRKAAASGSSFYYSFLFLPRDQRRAITALYAFCREVDDVVDEATDPGVARAKLSWWRGEVQAVFSGSPQHPVARALVPVARAFPISESRLAEIIAGMEMDLDYNRYPDFATLEVYCHRVAGVVGLLSAGIFGYTQPATLDYARTLGHRPAAHQHRPRCGPRRAPQSHLPSARRVGTLRPFEHGHHRAPGRRALRAAHGVPDRTRTRLPRPRLVPPAARRSTRAAGRLGHGRDLPGFVGGDRLWAWAHTQSERRPDASAQAVDRVENLDDGVTVSNARGPEPESASRSQRLAALHCMSRSSAEGGPAWPPQSSSPSAACR